MYINHPGLEPIEVRVIGDKPRVLPADPEFTIDDDGGLLITGGRKTRLVQFYCDRGGRRTVRLADLTFG